MKRFLILALALVCGLTAVPAFALRDVEVKYGNGSFALRQSDVVDARVLAANVAESHTVPSFTNGNGGTTYASTVVFSSTCNFYVKMGGTAAVPAADVTNGTASELNPSVRFLGGNVSSIGLITPDTSCVVTMNFYK